MKLAIRRPLGESRSPSAVPLGVPLLEQDCDPPAEAILLDVAGQQLLHRHRSRRNQKHGIDQGRGGDHDERRRSPHDAQENQHAR
jgi:hypothetical protein